MFRNHYTFLELLVYLILVTATTIGAIATDGAGGYYYPAIVIGVCCGGLCGEVFRFAAEEDSGDWCMMFKNTQTVSV